MNSITFTLWSCTGIILNLNISDIEITRLEIFDWNKKIQSRIQHRTPGVNCQNLPSSTKLVILNHSGLKPLDTVHSHNLKAFWLEVNKVNNKNEVYKKFVRMNDAHKIFYDNSVDRALVN